MGRSSRCSVTGRPSPRSRYVRHWLSLPPCFKLTIHQAVESAFVPVIKTVISGVEVDLLFARVNHPEAGDKLDIEKDDILRGVDDASQRSLNGRCLVQQAQVLMARSSCHRHDP